MKTLKTLAPETVVSMDGAVGGSSVSPVANALDPSGLVASTPRYRRIAAPPRLFPSAQVNLTPSVSVAASANRYQMVSRASSSAAMPPSNRVQPLGASTIRSRASATTAMSRSPPSPGGTSMLISWGWELDRFWAVLMSTNSGVPEDASEGTAVPNCKPSLDRTARPRPSATASERSRMAIGCPCQQHAPP